MKATMNQPPRMMVMADRAADLMTENPVSIPQNATVREALALFTSKGFGVAPVIDDAGRPIGVLSSSDLLVHDREKGEYLVTPEAVERAAVATPQGEPLKGGFEVENVDPTLVRDLMTPAVFSVTPESPIPHVVAEMLRLRVHHLFVVEKTGTLVGVISSLDVLRNLA